MVRPEVPKLISIFPTPTPSGHISCWVEYPDGERKHYLYHRLLYEQVHGKQPQNIHIHHIDGDPGNNNLENLKAMTASEHSILHNTTERLELECIVCHKKFLKYKYRENYRIKQGSSGPHCSRACACKRLHNEGKL